MCWWYLVLHVFVLYFVCTSISHYESVTKYQENICVINFFFIIHSNINKEHFIWEWTFRISSGDNSLWMLQGWLARHRSISWININFPGKPWCLHREKTILLHTNMHALIYHERRFDWSQVSVRLLIIWNYLFTAQMWHNLSLRSFFRNICSWHA